MRLSVFALQLFKTQRQPQPNAGRTEEHHKFTALMANARDARGTKGFVRVQG
jgi:hypothetical protein